MLDATALVVDAPSTVWPKMSNHASVLYAAINQFETHQTDPKHPPSMIAQGQPSLCPRPGRDLTLLSLHSTVLGAKKEGVFSHLIGDACVDTALIWPKELPHGR